MHQHSRCRCKSPSPPVCTLSLYRHPDTQYKVTSLASPLSIIQNPPLQFVQTLSIKASTPIGLFHIGFFGYPRRFQPLPPHITRNPSIVLDLKTISWATYFMLIDMKRRASLSACSQEIKKIVAASDSYVKWPILAELGLVWLCSLNPSVTWT